MSPGLPGRRQDTLRDARNELRSVRNNPVACRPRRRWCGCWSSPPRRGGLRTAVPASIDRRLRPRRVRGTSARGVLFDLDAGCQLIVEQVDDLAVAGRRYGLWPQLIHLAASVVERLATYALAFGKASAVLRVALSRRSRTCSVRVPASGAWLAGADDAVATPASAGLASSWISASRLFRSWIVALISRPLTRTALSPSVAAMIVLTPEVHADRRADGSRLHDDFADDLHRAVAEPDLDHASRQGHALGDAEPRVSPPCHKAGPCGRRGIGATGSRRALGDRSSSGAGTGMAHPSCEGLRPTRPPRRNRARSSGDRERAGPGKVP